MKCAHGPYGTHTHTPALLKKNDVLTCDFTDGLDDLFNEDSESKQAASRPKKLNLDDGDAVSSPVFRPSPRTSKPSSAKVRRAAPNFSAPRRIDDDFSTDKKGFFSKEQQRKASIQKQKSDRKKSSENDESKVEAFNLEDEFDSDLEIETLESPDVKKEKKTLTPLNDESKINDERAARREQRRRERREKKKNRTKPAYVTSEAESSSNFDENPLRFLF